MKKSLKYFLSVLGIFSLGLGMFVAYTEQFLFASWSELLSDEIIFHILAPLDGMDTSMVKKAFISYVIPLVIFCLAFGAFLILFKFSGRTVAIICAMNIAFGVLMTSTAAYDANERSGIAEYLLHPFRGVDDDFISNNFVDASAVEINFPEKKRNLIYIYMESMEITFADKESGGGFSKNVIPELTNLAKENECFGDETINGAYSMPGTNWTVAAMYAQASGLPVKLAISGSTFLLNEDGLFFPGVTALGDILKANDYRNYLLMGSDASFGFRDFMFVGHGGYRIHDYKWMNENGKLPYKDYKVFWGCEDWRLFQQAKEELLEVSSEEGPFNYTMLTVDTHFEDGHICEYCKSDFPEQYANVYACSSRQINEFINWIKEQDFYENTTIVLAGDHPTMDVDFTDSVSSSYERKTYYTIINGAPANRAEPSRREYSIFDEFPTTLASLGATIAGNRLGLGANLYSEAKTLVESLGVSEVASELEKPSNFYDNYFGYGLSEEQLRKLGTGVARLRWRIEPDESITVKLDAIGDLPVNEIKNVSLRMDLPEGESRTYDMDLEYYNGNDISGFHFIKNTDVMADDYDWDCKDIKATAFITVRDFVDFELKTINLFGEQMFN